MKHFFTLIMIAVFTVMPFHSFAGAGGKVVSKTLKETIEVAAKKSGRKLTGEMTEQMAKNLAKATAKYGDDAARLVREGGIEVLEQGVKHGDDFWKFCKMVPDASRNMAQHADTLLPLARKIGPEVLVVESKVPGMSAKLAEEFGDDAIRLLANKSKEEVVLFTGYAAKADSKATEKLLYETYRESSRPELFLKSIDWKLVMVTGLSSAAIISAYKISDGMEDGLREGLSNPEVAENLITKLAFPFQIVALAVFTFCLLPLGKYGYRWVRALTRKKRKATP